MQPSPRPLPAPWILAATAILLVFSVARLIGLDRLVVWHDEVFTLVRVFGHSQDALVAAIFSGRLLEPQALLAFQQPDPALGWGDAWRAFMGHPEHAPLYYVLVKLATGVSASLGLSPVTAARGVSALAGIALIPAAFWLARQLYGRGPAPWVAALLVASSPLALLYAQEARQYALWTLLVALSSAALLRAATSSARAQAWWLYGLLLTLGLYTHLLFVLMIPIHGVYLFLALNRAGFRRVLRPWVVSVGVSVAAFGPWILIILTHHEVAANYTAWMERPIGLARNLAEWSGHLTRLFVDLGPGAPGWWALLLIPLTLGLIAFLRHAPRPAIWLPLGITLAYVGVVLGPDLVLGGSRSQHVRYALPAMLAIELMLAWVIAAGLSAQSAGLRRGAAGTLALIVLLGGLSIARIERSDTWWTKQFSATNGEVARKVNGWEHPLVVAGVSGIAAGELISLAYRLDDRVRIWGEAADASPPISDSIDVMTLLPSPDLTAKLEVGHRLTPVAGTWQWLRLVPEQAVSETDVVSPSGPAPAAGVQP